MQAGTALKLHVHFQVGEIRVDEVVEGTSPEDVVAQMQSQSAQQAGFLIGALIRRMTPIQFAQEVTRRYNAATNDNAPVPTSCGQFLQMMRDKNFATLLEE
jgi:hypothetical protein